MMMKKIILAIVFLISANVYAQEVKKAVSGVTYGKTIDSKNALAVDALKSKMNSTEALNAKVTGKVLEVCSKKGCWMKLENANGEPMRVTFKDYGFFMPENIVGKNVVIKGISKVKTTSVAELKHYAEDAGKSKEEIAKINTPKQEISFEAEGVLVL